MSNYGKSSSLRSGAMPRSLISQRVKIPPVLFTSIGAEANSGRVSLVWGNLKSRMRENLKSGSVRGLIAASGRRWL